MHRKNNLDMKRLVTIMIVLISGAMVYWLFRPDIMLFKALGIHNSPLSIGNRFLSMLVRNYLSDFLWALAVVNTALLLKEKKIAAIYVYTLFVLPFASEALQFYKLIPGTFDWYDLLIYSIVYLFYSHSKIILLCRNYSDHLSAR